MTAEPALVLFVAIHWERCYDCHRSINPGELVAWGGPKGYDVCCERCARTAPEDESVP